MKKILFITLLGILLISEISAQGYLWARQSVGEVGMGSAEGRDVVCDSDGNTYVVGNFNNTIYFGDFTVSGNRGVMFIAKYDTQGDPLWVRQINGSSNNELYGISIDNDQNTYICGKYQQTNSGTILDFGTIQATGNRSFSTFLAKIDKDGNWIWVKTMLADDPVGQQYCTPDDVLFTDEGDIIMVGSLNTSVTIDGNIYASENGDVDAFYFAKYSSTGDLVWFKTGTGSFTGTELALAEDGRIIFGGTAGNTISFADNNITGPGSDDVLYGAINQDGNLLWWQTAGHPSYDERAKGLAIDQDDNIYLAFSNPFFVRIGDLQVDYNVVSDQYLYKFDDQGSFLWMQPLYAGSVPQGNGIHCIDILTDTNGKTYVTGSVESPKNHGKLLFFNDTVGGFGTRESFLAAYNQDGSYADVVEFKYTEEFDEGEFLPSHMVFDNDMNITMIGTFRNSIMVGGEMLEAGSLKHMYLIKVNPSELFNFSSGIFEWHANEVDMVVYPNPTKNVLNVVIKDRTGVSEYQLIDTLGKVMLSGTYSDKRLQIDISDLESGTYFLQITNKDWTGKKTFVKY